MKIERKCPFCSEEVFLVEPWGDVYLLKCLNKNTSAAQWVEMKKDGRFTPIPVEYPKPRTEMSSRAQTEFNKLQTPYWRMMGQKAKAKDIAYEKALKWRGMTYGDAVMERSLGAENQSALPEWNEAMSRPSYEPKYQKN